MCTSMWPSSLFETVLRVENRLFITVNRISFTRTLPCLDPPRSSRSKVRYTVIVYLHNCTFLKGHLIQFLSLHIFLHFILKQKIILSVTYRHKNTHGFFSLNTDDLMVSQIRTIRLNDLIQVNGIYSIKIQQTSKFVYIQCNINLFQYSHKGHFLFRQR